MSDISDSELLELVRSSNLKRLQIDPKKAGAVFDKFGDWVSLVESSRRVDAKNPENTAAGLYQYTADSLRTAVNRLENTIGSQNLPAWAVAARESGDARTLDAAKQKILFEADTFQKPTWDDTLRAMSAGDASSGIEFYKKYHHTKPNEATLKRIAALQDQFILGDQGLEETQQPEIPDATPVETASVEPQIPAAAPREEVSVAQLDPVETVAQQPKESEPAEPQPAINWDVVKFKYGIAQSKPLEFSDKSFKQQAFWSAVAKENVIALLAGAEPDNGLQELKQSADAAGRFVDPEYDWTRDQRLEDLDAASRLYFSQSNSYEHTTSLLSQYKAEKTLERNLSGERGAQIMGTVTGAVVDPSLMALPAIRATTKGSQILRAAGVLGTEEVTKQILDPSREDSYLAYALGAAPIVGLLQRTKPMRNLSLQEAAQVEERVLREMVFPDPNDVGVLGAAVNPKSKPLSVTDDVAEMRPADAVGGIHKLNLNPISVLLNEPDTKLAAITQSIVTRALEIPIYLRGNLANRAMATPSDNAETLLRSGRGPMVETFVQIRDKYSNYAMRVTGKRPSGMRMALDRSRADELSFRQFGREITKAIGNGGKHSIPEVAEAATFVRKYYDDMWEKGQRTGTWEGIAASELRAIDRRLEELRAPLTSTNPSARIAMEAERARLIRARDIVKDRLERARNGSQSKRSNYFNVVYRRDFWKQNKDHVIRIIMKEGKHPQSVAEEIYNDIVKTVPYRGNQAMRSAQARTLNIDPMKFVDDAVGDAVETDIFSLMRMYQRSTDADIGLYSKFGSIDLADEIDAIRKLFKEQAEGMSPSQMRAHQKKMESTIQRVEAVRDLVRGTYGLPTDPANMSSRFIRMSKNFAALTLLTGPLAALPDLGRVVMVNGLTNTLGSTYEALFAGFGTWKASKSLMNSVGEAADMIMAANAARVTDLGDYIGVYTGFERGLERSTNFYFNYINGMNFWTDTMKTLNGVVTQTQLLKGIEAYGTGKISAKMKARLAKLGIDEPMAQRILKENANWEKTKHNIIAHTDQWADDVARETFERAMGIDARFTIVTPGLGDAPLFATDIRSLKGVPDWVSPELGSLLFQFKKFGLSAHQKVLVAGLQGDKRDAMIGITTMVALGGLVDYIRSTQTLGPSYSKRSTKQRMFGAVERAGIVAPFLDASHFAETLTDMTLGTPVGIKSVLGLSPPYDPTMRQLVGNLVGPAAVPYANLYDLLTTESNTLEARRIRELVWSNRLAHLDWFWDSFEKAIR